MSCTCKEPKIIQPEDIEAIENIINKYCHREGILVDLLHDIQHYFGYLPEFAISYAAERLGISKARIYGVASFYSGFYFTPRPKNQIKVCTGTACHVRGAPKVIKEFEKLIGISPGEHTEDMSVGLETVSCVGCCALAPVIVVNGVVARQTTPQKIVSQLDLGEKNESDKES